MYYKFWNNNIVKLDLIYKINILNNYTIPYITDIFINLNSYLVQDNQLIALYLITLIKFITNQKPIIKRFFRSVNSLKNQKKLLLGLKVILRKNVAFNFMDSFIFLTAINFKEVKLVKLNGINSLSMSFNNLNFFPQLASYCIKLLNPTFTMNINFNLLKFDILSLILSSLQIPYKTK